MKVNCSKCGVEFNKPPCQVKRVKNVFCSKQCHDAFQTIYASKVCEVCAGVFKIKGNMKRYSTCPKPECRSEKIRREHAARFKGSKVERNTLLRKVDPEEWYLRSVKRLYGLTPDLYKSMVNAQGGSCAICGVVKDKLVVDHCHASGVVRGLLCQSCNRALGGFKDNEWVLARAITYLKRHGLQAVPKGAERSIDGEQSA